VEHRYYPRLPVSAEVHIFRRDQHIGRAFTKDISLGGMTLQNDQPKMKRNDVIVLRAWIQGEELSIRGFVVHASSKYCGVMLIDMGKAASRAFFKYLRDMEAPLRMALDTTENLVDISHSAVKS